MLAASLYVMACSARNRVRVRLRRLKEPRYLVGAVVGALYLYFSVFARMRVGSRPRRRGRNVAGAAIPPALAAAGPALAGLLLMAITAVGWLVPFESGLLDFTEAETAFLFPAPVSRRQLLIHRMLRSQLGLLFGAVILGIARPATSGLTRLQTSVGMWLLLFTGKVCFTGMTLARSRWHSADRTERRLGWLPVLATFGATLIVGRTLYRTFAVTASDTPSEAFERLGAALTHGPASLVLWPFVALARPLFASSLSSFAQALVASAAVLAAAIAWVLWSDAAFQDAAAQVAERRQQSAAATKGGFKVRGPGVRLALSGRPELAFAWKGMMQTLRIVDRRSLVRLVAILASVTIPAVAIGRTNGFGAMVGIFAAIGVAFAILMAPQALRADLREDLLHLELLKTWPVDSAALVRGEIIWPTALLTMLSWGLVGVALLLSPAVFARVAPAMRVAVAAAVAILGPALILAQYAIHNGVALMFPAWVPLGSTRARGFDAMGQRLILLGATWLALLVIALPGGIAGAIVWFGFRRWLGAAVLVPAASLAAGIIAIEVLIASEALGPAFDKVDVGAVERGE